MNAQFWSRAVIGFTWAAALAGLVLLACSEAPPSVPRRLVLAIMPFDNATTSEPAHEVAGIAAALTDCDPNAELELRAVDVDDFIGDLDAGTRDGGEEVVAVLLHVGASGLVDAFERRRVLRTKTGESSTLLGEVRDGRVPVAYIAATHRARQSQADGGASSPVFGLVDNSKIAAAVTEEIKEEAWCLVRHEAGQSYAVDLTKAVLTEMSFRGTPDGGTPDGGTPIECWVAPRGTSCEPPPETKLRKGCTEVLIGTPSWFVGNASVEPQCSTVILSDALASEVVRDELRLRTRSGTTALVVEPKLPDAGGGAERQIDCSPYSRIAYAVTADILRGDEPSTILPRNVRTRKMRLDEPYALPGADRQECE